MHPATRNRRSIRRALLSGLTAILLVTGGATLVTATPAFAANCGDVVLAGSSWLSGNGVDVHSNGTDTGTGTSCTGSAGVYNLSANPPQMGMGWQCVELVQRLYDTRGWYSGTSFGVSYAYQIYDSAASIGFTRQANGSITSIAPGDLVVQGVNDSYSPNSGHVDVVDSVVGTTVNIVQQNSSSATTTYTLTSGTLSGASGGDIVGIVHSPANTSTGGSSGGGSHGTDDFGVWRLTGGTGYWYVKDGRYPTGSTYVLNGVPNGSSGDVPVVGDFNND